VASWLGLLASNTTNKKCQTKQLWVVLCGKCFGAKINFYKYKQNPFFAFTLYPLQTAVLESIIEKNAKKQ